MAKTSDVTRGPGRPKTRGAVRRIGFELDDDLAESVLAAAEREGKTITDAAHEAFRLWLARKARKRA